MPGHRAVFVFPWVALFRAVLRTAFACASQVDFGTPTSVCVAVCIPVAAMGSINAKESAGSFDSESSECVVCPACVLVSVLTVRAHLLLFCSAMDTLATALRQMALASLMRTLKLHRQIAATVERKTRPPGTPPTTVRVAAVLAVWQCLIVRRAPQIQTWCRTFSPGSTVVTMFT